MQPPPHPQNSNYFNASDHMSPYNLKTPPKNEIAAKQFMQQLHMLGGTFLSAMQMQVQLMKLRQGKEANYSSVWWLGLYCAWAPSRLETEASKHLIS